MNNKPPKAKDSLTPRRYKLKIQVGIHFTPKKIFARNFTTVFDGLYSFFHLLSPKGGMKVRKTGEEAKEKKGVLVELN